MKHSQLGEPLSSPESSRGAVFKSPRPYFLLYSNTFLASGHQIDLNGAHKGGVDHCECSMEDGKYGINFFPIPWVVFQPLAAHCNR